MFQIVNNLQEFLGLVFLPVALIAGAFLLASLIGLILLTMVIKAIRRFQE